MLTFQTDSLNPSALPSSSLGRRRPAPASTSAFDTANLSSSDPDAARQRFHEEWNVRIDKDVKAVAGGLRELVDLADIGPNPSAHSPTPTALHLRLKTAQLIRSAQSLRDMAHELRLMLLLSDEVDTARRRDGEVRLVQAELDLRREAVSTALRELLGGEREDDRKEAGQGEQTDQAQAVNEIKGQENRLADEQDTRDGQAQVVAPVAEIVTGTEEDLDVEEDEDDFEEV